MWQVHETLETSLGFEIYILFKRLLLRWAVLTWSLMSWQSGDSWNWTCAVTSLLTYLERQLV